MDGINIFCWNSDVFHMGGGSDKNWNSPLWQLQGLMRFFNSQQSLQNTSREYLRKYSQQYMYLQNDKEYLCKYSQYSLQNTKEYTQSQKKRNFSSWIFLGAQGQGHVTLVYTLLQKKGNFQKVAFLLRKSVLTQVFTSCQCNWGILVLSNTYHLHTLKDIYAAYVSY